MIQKRASKIIGAILGTVTPLVGALSLFDVLDWTEDQLSAVMLAGNAVGAMIVAVIEAVTSPAP